MSQDSHPTTKDRVRELAASGLRVTAIARELGVSKPTVCFHMRSLGIAGDSRFTRRYDWHEIRAYYDAGHSMVECKAAFGFSGAAWSEAVERGDVVPRPRAQAHEAVLVRGPKRSRFHLKARLVADGLKEPRCEECGRGKARAA